MTTLYGWDASHYDGMPDGARVVAEKFSFMTTKAGGDLADNTLGPHWQAMLPYRAVKLAVGADGVPFLATADGRPGVLLGAYWVQYPGHPAGRADDFIARLDDQCPGWRDGPFLLQADCERWGSAATQPQLADIQAFCDRLVWHMPKLQPIVYASQGQYGNTLTGLGYPLWNANYPSSMSGAASAIYAHIGGDNGPGWVHYSGQDPKFWQITDAATIAGQTTCDADVFRGTPADLIATVAPGWVVPDMNGTDTYNDYGHPGRTVDQRFADDGALRDWLWGDPAGIKAAPSFFPNAPLPTMLAAAQAVPGLVTAVQQIQQTLAGQPKATAGEVLAELAGRSLPEIVAALKAVLGDQAAAVGAGLQTP